jgi:hypothetical protein
MEIGHRISNQQINSPRPNDEDFYLRLPYENSRKNMKNKKETRIKQKHDNFFLKQIIYDRRQGEKIDRAIKEIEKQLQMKNEEYEKNKEEIKEILKTINKKYASIEKTDVQVNKSINSSIDSTYASKQEMIKQENQSNERNELFDNVIKYGIPIISSLVLIGAITLIIKKNKQNIDKNERPREISPQKPILKEIHRQKPKLREIPPKKQFKKDGNS